MMPRSGSWKPQPGTGGLRLWPVKDFEEFLIFYVVDGDTVRVIRILHGKRDLARRSHGNRSRSGNHARNLPHSGSSSRRPHVPGVTT
jgi:hypothetical protein